jgi:hypothetical protein
MPRGNRLSLLDAASADPASADQGERVVLRFAGDADAPALEWLRQRDSSSLPPPPHLVAEVDGSIRAALSLRTGETIADPFTHTARLRDMLAARASQLEAPRPRPRLALVRRARGYVRGEAW